MNIASFRKRRKKRINCPNRYWWRQQILSMQLSMLTGCLALYGIVMGIRRLRVAELELKSKKLIPEISHECRTEDSTVNAYASGNDVKTQSLVTSASSSSSFRVLCTSTRNKITWGSYELRCRDLDKLAKRCTKDVVIQTNVSFEDFERLRWFRSIFGWLTDEERISYNASIFVKSYPKLPLPLYGKMFMDVVDEYSIPDDDIPDYVELILQTKWQGEDMFPSHNYFVVEHWYNSFPADMARAGDPEGVPTVSDKQHLEIATIWNTRRSHEPTEGGCPQLSVSNISYYCLDREFDISKWYLKIMKQNDDICEMERTLSDSEYGPGKLYINIFRKYDALVVLAKNHTMKLNYGNVQRTVSQMRSGVPVLVEIRGQVLEDFVQHYNYTCAFQRYTEPSKIIHRKLWSFNEAVEKLKDPEIRRECQRQGLEIVKEYSPSLIGKKFLQTLGYQGNFMC